MKVFMLIGEIPPVPKKEKGYLGMVSLVQKENPYLWKGLVISKHVGSHVKGKTLLSSGASHTCSRN